MKHKKFIPYWFIKSVEDVTIKIRKILSEKYDINNGDNKNYMGLCEEACDLFIELAPEELEKKGISGIEVCKIHGEQKHSFRIKSEDWIWQHTWLEVSCEGMVVYVDATSQQFKFLYNDIPDYYISYQKPKWYLPDNCNPCFSGITSKINQLIEFKFTNKELGFRYSKGIIDIIIYNIIGSLSDVIRKVYLLKKII